MLTDFLNWIINGFFDSIRGTRKVEDYQNMDFSWEGIFATIKPRIGFLFLLAVGLSYVAFVVISGLSLIICRCCGRCGSKPPAIDHSKATNKLAVFKVIFLFLILFQILSAFMIQSNNLIIYRKLRSKDKEENWFRNYETVYTKFNRSWNDLYQKMNKLTVHSNYSKLVIESIKKCMKIIKSGLEEISKRLLKTRDVNELISKAKVAKKTLEDLPKSFKGDQKKKYDNVSYVIAILKNNTAETIRKVNVFTCSNDKCRNNVYMYKNLNFMKDKKLKETFNKYYEFLSDDQISKELDDVINIKSRGDSLMKKMINETEQNSKKIILNLTKQELDDFCSRVHNDVTKAVQLIYFNTHIDGDKLKMFFLYDSYRYFGWLTIFLVVVLISLMFLIGFLFGVVGKGDARENRCSKKIVGSRILMVSVGISFFLAPFLMVIVIVFMASLGSFQSEVCQYTVPNSRTIPVYEYIIRNEKRTYNGIDLILVKCKNKTIFEMFLKLRSESMIKTIQSYVGSTKLNYNFDKTFDKYSKIEEMKKYVNELIKNIIADIASYMKIIEYYKSHQKEIVSDLISQKKQLESIHDKLSIIINDTNPLNTDLLKTNKTYKILLSNLTDLQKKTTRQILKVVRNNIVTLNRKLITPELEDLKCNDIRENVFSVFDFLCSGTLSYLNGSWYGLGLFLFLLVPTVIVALFVEMLFRQLQDSQEVKLNPNDNVLNLSVSEATGIKSIPDNTHIAEVNASIGIDFNLSQSDATEIKTVTNENVIAKENELNGNEVDDAENKPNTLNYNRFSAIYQLRDKALKLKNSIQFKIKNIFKSEEVTNKSDVANNQEFTVHFNDLTKKEKNNCYESDIHSLRNYPFKITMFIENDENVVFYLVALKDENVDSLEWPVPFSMTMMAKNNMGMVLWTMAAESNQSGHTCDIDTSKGLYSCDVVTQLSDLGNECFITVKVV